MKDDCVVYRTSSFIGKKWTIPLLLELSKGVPTKRYNQIKKSLVNITPKILSQRLKELEKEGLIEKVIDKSKFPIKSEYCLTPVGREFIKVIDVMKKWALKNKFQSEYCKNHSCENCLK